MGFTLLRKAVTLAPLFATIVLFSACSEELPEQSEEAEIKSINIFFSKEDEAGASVGKAYSYSPDTGLVTEIATINDTPDSIAVLDTDEEAPGYEFAAFAEGRKLKLIDYSKTATKRIYELEAYSADICGVYPVKRPAYNVFDRDSDYYLKTIDAEAVNVALKVGSTCSRTTDTYRQISFNIPGFPLIADTRSASTSEVFGAYLFEPSFRTTDDDGNAVAGRSIWVSHNRETESLSARTYNGPTLFEIPFKYKSSNKPSSAAETAPPVIIQANDSRVLIQKNKITYDNSQILTASTIELYELSISRLQQLLGSNEIVSPSNLVEDYFSIANAQINSNEQPAPAKHIINGLNIVLEADNNLYRYRFDSNVIKEIYTAESGLQHLKFSLLTSGDAIVSKTFNGYQTLSLISTEDDIGNIAIINSADEVSFTSANGQIFINTLNPSNILNEAFNSNSWVAAEIQTNRIIRAVNDAMLIFVKQYGKKDEVLIASSSESATNSMLIKPYISKYDGSYPDGIFNFEELDDDERVTARTEARIGQITDNVISVANNIKGANFSLNRFFGGFQVTTDSGSQGYFFKPNQTENEENNREPSLTLIRDKSTTEAITINAQTTTEQASTLSLEL